MKKGHYAIKKKVGKNWKMDLSLSESVFMFPFMPNYEKTLSAKIMILRLPDTQVVTKLQNSSPIIIGGPEFSMIFENMLKDARPARG